jgi:hypothetical protein
MQLITQTSMARFRAGNKARGPRGLRAFRTTSGHCRQCLTLVSRGDVRNLPGRGGESVYLCVQCAGVW